jgi:hypothetical protein
VASFSGGTFYWRGELYRFEPGGRIVAQHRAAEVLPETVEAEKQ